MNSSFPRVPHFASPQDSFLWPLHSAWDYSFLLQWAAVSGTLQHTMQCFQAALLTARDLWSLFGTPCTLQSDIPKSTLLSVWKQGPFHSQPQTIEWVTYQSVFVLGNQHANKTTYPRLSILRESDIRTKQHRSAFLLMLTLDNVSSTWTATNG